MTVGAHVGEQHRRCEAAQELRAQHKRGSEGDVVGAGNEAESRPPSCAAPLLAQAGRGRSPPSSPNHVRAQQALEHKDPVVAIGRLLGGHGPERAGVVPPS